METPELAVLNWQLINFQSGSKWPWHDSILPAGSTLRSDAMYVQPWARLSWRAWAAGSAPWGEIWEDSWMGRKAWSGLSASCVRQALLVYVWSQEKMSRHSLDAAAANLARSGDCAGGRVGEGCLRCFVCRYFGSVDSSVEHRPTCIGAVPGLWFHYTIPASWLGQVSKCRVWSGPHKAAASKTGFALCSGRPSRGCREPPVFAFPWWPSIPTDIFETFSESLNGRIGTLPVTASLANPCVAGEGVELVGLGRFGTQFWKQFWNPNLRSPWLR